MPAPGTLFLLRPGPGQAETVSATFGADRTDRSAHE